MKNQVLSAMTEDTTQAQYLLADRSIEFLKAFIDKMNYELVICLGMPRLFEEINTCKGEVFLFDIDDRFRTFHKNFCQYNMFNNHFFSSTENLNFKAALSNLSKPRVLIITDPPYAGLVDVFIDSYKCFTRDWNLNPDLIWIFPYFHERQISLRLPSVKMINYIVSYDNHKKFQNNLNGHNSSPVRIFTNVEQNLFDFDSEKNNEYCKECKLHVFKGASHCSLCEKCYGWSGKTFNHCFKCGKCFKSTWKHCTKCGKCQPTYHKC